MNVNGAAGTTQSPVELPLIVLFLLNLALLGAALPAKLEVTITSMFTSLPKCKYLCVRDVKNVFFTFFILLNVFLYKKTCIENPIKYFVKHFWDHRNKLIGHSDVVYLVSPNILKQI